MYQFQLLSTVENESGVSVGDPSPMGNGRKDLGISKYSTILILSFEITNDNAKSYAKPAVADINSRQIIGHTIVNCYILT